MRWPYARLAIFSVAHTLPVVILHVVSHAAPYAGRDATSPPCNASASAPPSRPPPEQIGLRPSGAAARTPRARTSSPNQGILVSTSVRGSPIVEQLLDRGMNVTDRLIER